MEDLNDPAIALWMMSFYNGYYSLAITHPPGTEASNVAAQMRSAQQGYTENIPLPVAAFFVYFTRSRNIVRPC